MRQKVTILSDSVYIGRLGLLTTVWMKPCHLLPGLQNTWYRLYLPYEILKPFCLMVQIKPYISYIVITPK